MAVNVQGKSYSDVITASDAYSSVTATLTVLALTVANVTISPPTVVGPATATGTVRLTAAAQSGGAVVSLSVSQPKYTGVNPSVTVPAGSTAATFPVDTVTVTSDVSSTVSATYTNNTQTANIEVVPVTYVSTLTLNPTSVVEGSSSTGTVTLGMPAPTGGWKVTLNSQNASTTVPASVTVASGSTTATFTATTSITGKTYVDTITASDPGSSVSASLSVSPIQIASVTVSPSTIVGPQTATGTVTLNSPAPTGGAKVSLSVSQPKYTGVNPSVTVTAGSTSATFPVDTVAVSSEETSTITASYNSSTQTASIEVVPTTYISSFSFSPSSVVEGGGSTGTVVLGVPAPSGGWVVTLTNPNSNVSMPSTVTVSSGNTSATFTATTAVTGSAYSDTVTASDPVSSATATLTVSSGPTIAALDLDPNSVVGGDYSTGTVTINSPAPSFGFTVNLTVSNSGVSVPFTVTIPSGSTSVTFYASTASTSTQYVCTVTAYNQDSNATAYLTVNPGSNLRAPSTVVQNPPNGVMVDPLELPDWMEQTIPRDQSDASFGGPASAFSVNLPFGVLDLDTGSDIEVQDSLVGAIDFGVRYRTAMAAANLSSVGLPAGWTHNWEFRIVNTQSGPPGPLQLVYPSGAWDQLIPVIENGSPTGVIAGPSGAPYTVSGQWNYKLRVWTDFVVNYDGNRQDIYSVPPGDTTFRLTSRVLADNQAVTLNYSSSTPGELITIQGGSNTITLAYSSNLITSAQSSSSNSTYPQVTVNYGCSNGQLNTISNVVTGTTLWSFNYETEGSSQFLYQATTAGETATVGFDSNYRPQTLTDANGNVRTYSYTNNTSAGVATAGPNAGIDARTETSDGYGRVTSWTQAASGTTTTFAYDDPVNPAGISKAVSPTGQTLTISRDQVGNPTQITYPYGNYTELYWNYNAAGFPHGQLTATKEFSNGNPAVGLAPTNYTYFTSQNATSQASVGFLQSVTYPNGGVVSYTYTQLGSLASVQAPDAAGILRTTIYGYGPSEMVGKPLTITDPLQYITNITYGSAGVASITDPLGYQVSGTFDGYNEPTAITTPGLTNGSTYSYGFNYAVASKPPTWVNVTGNGVSPYLQTVSTDKELAPSTVTGASLLPSTSMLSPEYLLNQLTNGNGKAMHSFTRTPAQKTDSYTIGTGANSETWTDNYNGDGDTTSFLTPLSTGTSGSNVWTNGLLTGTSYNPNGLNYQNSYSYDAYGRLAEAFNFQTSLGHGYTYDAENHVIADAVNSGVGTSSVATVSTAYSSGGGVTSKTISVSNGRNPIVYTYSYDADSDLTNIVVTSNGSNVAGMGVTYSYDADHRVTSSTTSQGATFYQYDPLGEVTSVQNLTANNVHDDPNTSADPVVTDSTGFTHQTFSTFTNIGYDVLGNRTGMTYWARNPTYGSQPFQGTATWTLGSYSGSGQSFLESEQWKSTNGNPWPGISYSYAGDGGGNLTTVRGSTGTVDQNTDEITSNGFSYDAIGDALGLETFYSSQQQNSLTATYDPMGELSNLTCSSPATISEYFQYDASGLRIYRNANTAVDSYFYDGETLVARQPGNGAVYYLYGPTGLIQECTENISGAFSNVYTYSFDPNGNTVQRNQTYPGGPQNYSSYIVDTPALYDAYGQQNWANWFQGPPNDVNNGVADLNGLIFRYKGQYGCVTDTESGLVYCSHRYYDPFVARWITRDPIGLDGGINTYQYCNGNPVSTADPSGLEVVFGLGSMLETAQFISPGRISAHDARLAIKVYGGGALAALLVLTSAQIEEAAAAAAILKEARELMLAARGIEGLENLKQKYGPNLTKMPGFRSGPDRMHHLLPQQLESAFKTHKIDINAPIFLRPVPEWWHITIHSGRGTGRGGWWNYEWRKFFDEEPQSSSYTRADIMKQLAKMLASAGVPDLYGP